MTSSTARPLIVHHSLHQRDTKPTTTEGVGDQPTIIQIEEDQPNPHAIDNIKDKVRTITKKPNRHVARQPFRFS